MAHVETATQHAFNTILGLFGRANLATRVHHEVTLPDEVIAQEAFLEASARLLDVNRWGELGPRHPLQALWLLHDAGGHPVERAPRVGDFIRLGLPPSPWVPGHAFGGPDWVRVDDVEFNDVVARITVRPSWDPTARPLRPTRTCHFFTDQGRNHFLVERAGVVVRATVVGEHEHVNLDPSVTGSAWRSARNLVVAGLGWGLGLPRRAGGMDSRPVEPLAGLERLMWAPFTRGLLLA